MRVFNWMLPNKTKDDVTAFLGSVGSDHYGAIYENLLINEHIVPILEPIDKNLTGVCLVVCYNRDRAHFTDLAASTMISDEFVERFWNKFKDVKLIYTELFILKSKREITFKLANLGLKDDCFYGFNLPSFFFIENFFKDILDLISYADIVFSNDDEAQLFCLKSGIVSDGSIEGRIKGLVKLPKRNKNKKRIFVITAGPNPAWVAEYDFKNEKITYCKEFPVRFVEQENIIDTNGAGDSFSGGFLSQFMKGYSLDKCMIAGHWAASIIIQKRGCQIPAEINYIPNEEFKDNDNNV
jgi:adenosine kinase